MNPDAALRVGDMSEAECNAPTPFRDKNVSLCMSMPRWLEVSWEVGAGEKEIERVCVCVREEIPVNVGKACSFHLGCHTALSGLADDIEDRHYLQH